MLIIKEITIDLTEREILNPVEAVQNDANTRAVKVMLLNCGVAWAPPSGAVPSVAFKKPDGTSGWYDTLPDGTAACTVTDNAVTAIFAPQLLTAAGKVKAAVVFQDAKLNQLATFVFTVDVQANPAAGSSISNDYYKYSTMEEIDAAVDTWLTETEAEKNDFLAKAEEALTTIREVVTEAEDAPAILCEASGNVIAVSDASDRLLHGLNLYGKTTQDGTPSPSDPVELVSAGNSGIISATIAGKNLYGNGDVKVANAYVGYQVIEFPVYDGYPQFTLSFNPNGFTGQINSLAQTGKTFYLSGTESRASVVITPNKSNVNGMLFYTTSGTSSVINFTDIQIELGNTATEYEPYKGQTLAASTPNGLPGIPVSSGGNYTDENGQQWICDEVDFARGVYVQRTMLLENFTKGATNTNTDRYNQSAGTRLIGNSNVASVCTVIPTSGYAFNSFDSVHYYVNTAYGSAVVFVPVGFDNSNNIIKMLVALETPVETVLSAEELAAFAALHSNKPNTTAYNDAGTGMRLTYAADTKYYIDNKFTELQNAVLSAGANI